MAQTFRGFSLQPVRGLFFILMLDLKGGKKQSAAAVHLMMSSRAKTNRGMMGKSVYLPDKDVVEFNIGTNVCT